MKTHFFKAFVLKKYSLRFRKYSWIFFVFLFSITINLAIPSVASAGIIEDAMKVGLYLISLVISLYVSLMGQILLFLVNAFIFIAQYNDFIDAKAVQIGWVLVRDVANMFFVLIFLLIAFGTILRIEQYHWKKLLPRFVLLAVFVNFSKTIVGLFIDFGQVVMLTFVNGFAAAAGGNFVRALQADNILKMSGKVEAAGILGVDWQLFVTFVLGAILITVAVVVIMAFFAILAFRMVALWVLIILSPAAFLLGTFPQGQSYYADWWKRLTNQIIVGPIMAFFIWLALASVGTGDTYSQLSQGTGKQFELSEESRTGISAAGEWQNMFSFAVSIAFLMLGLQFSTQLGVLGASMVEGLSKRAMSAIPKYAAKLGYAPIKYGALLTHAKTGGPISRLLAAPGTYVDSFKHFIQERKQHYLGEGAVKAKEKVSKERRGLTAGFRTAFAAAGSPDDFFKDYAATLGVQGIKRVFGMRENRQANAKQRAEEIEGQLKEVEKGKNLVVTQEEHELQQTQLAVAQESAVDGATEDNDVLNVAGNIAITADPALQTRQTTAAPLLADARVEKKKADDARKVGDEAQAVIHEAIAAGKQRDAQRILDPNKAGKEEALAEARQYEEAAKRETDPVDRAVFLDSAKTKRKEAAEFERKETREKIVRETLEKTEKDFLADGQVGKANRVRSMLENGSVDFNDAEVGANIKANVQSALGEETVKQQQVIQTTSEAVAARAAAPATYIAASENEKKAKQTPFEEQKKTLQGELRQQESIIARTLPPQMAYAEAKARELVEEEKKFLPKEPQNSNAYWAQLQDAMQQGNHFRGAAIMENLTRDANLNDALGFAGYDSDFQGLSDFMWEYFQGGHGKRWNVRTGGYEDPDEMVNGKKRYERRLKKGGFHMGDQEALAFQARLGFLAEENRHFVYSRNATVGTDGRWKRISEDRQSDATMTEIMKGDPEQIFRRANRLSFGGETPDGQFKPGLLAYKIASQIGSALTPVFDRNRISYSFASRLLGAIKNLTAIQRQQLGITEDWIKGGPEGKYASPDGKSFPALETYVSKFPASLRAREEAQAGGGVRKGIAEIIGESKPFTVS